MTATVVARSAAVVRLVAFHDPLEIVNRQGLQRIAWSRGAASP
jgi:hypothetical protein